MKKKVIALTIETLLTNEQIERGDVIVTVSPGPESAGQAEAIFDLGSFRARNVRVLDSDEVKS